MTRQSAKEIERETARKELLEILKPGDTVYCVLRHVSRSGMQREISFFTEGMRNIDYLAARLLDLRHGKRDGLVVSGCGMDMGFSMVYEIGSALFPAGFGEPCREDGCEFRPSTKKEAEECLIQSEADKAAGITPHRFFGRNGGKSGWDNDGGHALKSRWI